MTTLIFTGRKCSITPMAGPAIPTNQLTDIMDTVMDTAMDTAMDTVVDMAKDMVVDTVAAIKLTNTEISTSATTWPSFI